MPYIGSSESMDILIVELKLFWVEAFISFKY
jgi:hypothetical protein